MFQNDIDLALSFDDVLIRPEYTEIESRNDVDTSVEVAGIPLSVPLISSPMDTVTEAKMAITIGELGGMGVLHRFASDEERINMIYEVQGKFGRVPVVYAVGASQHEMDFMMKVERELSHYYVDAVCVDLANGWSITCKRMIEFIQDKFPELKIIAGNVACGEGYRFLAKMGVDAVRVGIGSGCFTASTKVLMSDGTYKNINKIQVGERVINKFGQPVRVNAVINNGFKKVKRVRTSNWAEPFYVTDNHQYWVSDLNDVKRLNKRSKRRIIEKGNRIKWMPIGMTNKKVVALTPSNIQFELPESFEESLEKYTKSNHYLNDIVIKSNYEVGYVFGMMLGDGHAFLNTNGKTEIGRINCYLGSHEENIADKFISCLKNNFGVSAKKIYTDSIINVVSYSKPLAHFFDQFKIGGQKSLPKKFLVKNKEYIQGIYDGLVDSDGHTDSYGRVTFTNTSEKLKELFEFCSIFLGKTIQSVLINPTTGGLKNCNIDNCKPSYRVRNHTSNRMSENYWYSTILEVEDTEVLQETWDIEVDCPTHSFIANNSIVHNSICSTRIQTGIGIPLLQSILECHEERVNLLRRGENAPDIIADGGIKYPKDLAKSLIAGASAVMCGGIFAGTEEAPGEVIQISEKDFRKRYRGMACYSDDTEVLTYKGWKLFSDVTLNDEILTLNHESNVAEYQKPIKKYEYDYIGEMYSINSKTIDLLVTPNHKLYIAKSNWHRENQYKLIEAQDAYDFKKVTKRNRNHYMYKVRVNWNGKYVERFTIPKSDLTFNMNDWLDFFGFWIAEGSIYKYIQKKKYEVYVTEISNNDKDLMNHYSEILSSAGLKHAIQIKKGKTRRGKQDHYIIKVYNRNLYNYLEKFGKAKDKFIPNEFKFLCSEQLNTLLDGIFKGDGCKSRNTICTVSKKLADDIVEIGIKAGRYPRKTLYRRAGTNWKNFKHNYDLYYINVNKDAPSETFVHEKHQSIKEYTGKVFCVEVPNHIICVRRNNKIAWCGNSTALQNEKRGGLKKGTVAEGVSTLIPYEGSLEKVVNEFAGGLKSSMTYVNARTTKEYIGTPHRLIRITDNGLTESHAYGTRKR